MKALLAAILLASASPAFCQLGTFTHVEIGADNSLGMGEGMALGTFNTWGDFTYTTINTFMIGNGNYVNSDILASENLLIVGAANGVDYALNSAVIGNLNYVNDAVNNAMIVGLLNTFDSGSASIVVGTNNEALSFENGAMIGYGLVSSDYNYIAEFGTIIGKYNNIDTRGSGRLFTIGNGTASNNRKNAFLVYDNGDVIIPKRQGSILMGDFGNPGD